jgi:hypothetical protein
MSTGVKFVKILENELYYVSQYSMFIEFVIVSQNVSVNNSNHILF